MRTIRIVLILCNPFFGLFCSGKLSAQSYSLVTPQNLNSVVEIIYAQYGGVIQIPKPAMLDFLKSLQPNFDPSLPAPMPHLIKNTAEGTVFEWNTADGALYTAAYLDTKTGNQETSVTTGPQYVFANLTPQDLYLFAFTTMLNERESATWVTLGKSGFIIIIDDKILFTGHECDYYKPAGSGTNAVNVNLGPGQSSYYRIRVSACPATSVTPDSMYLFVRNLGISISGSLIPAWQCPQNANDYASGATGLSYYAPAPVNLVFAPTGPVAGYTGFSIVNTSATERCAVIQVDACKGNGEGGNKIIPDHPAAYTFEGVAPNPAGDFARLSLGGQNLMGAHILLMNGPGKILQEFQIAEDVDHWVIDLHRYPPGLYFLVVNQSSRKTFKILKAI